MASYSLRCCCVIRLHGQHLINPWNKLYPVAPFASGRIKKERPSTESLIQWKKLPVPKGKPEDPWSEKNALFGENDYKDILGDGSYDLRKNIKSGPWWLKGWKPNNVLQMLVAKKKAIGRDMGPQERHDLQKQIFYYYKKLNRNKGKWMYRGDD